MNKVLTSLLMITIATSLVATGTYAYFSDTEVSTGNTFTAGTLDLIVNTEEPLSSHFTVGDLYPGWAGYIFIPVTNSGSIPGVLTMEITNLVDKEIINPDADIEAVAGVLSEEFDIFIVEGIYIYDIGALSAFPSEGISLGAIGATTTRHLILFGSIDGAVGNGIQGDKVSFDIVVTLEQDVDANGIPDMDEA